MPRIDTKVVSHPLIIHPNAKLVEQRKWKVGEEKRAVIDEEVGKLSYIGFITQINYLPTYLADMVLVKKANKRWCMCVDFTKF